LVLRKEGRRRELHVEAVGGGGLLRRDGAPVGEGERGRAGELRWRLGKLVGCPVRAHGDRRRELCGGLGGGGANGGRRQLWMSCGARSGARSREERRIRTSGSSWNGLGGPGRERGRARSAGAIRRRRGASSGHPRRMCKEMAPRGETEKRRGGTREGARAGARRVAVGLAHGRRWTGEGEEQREERERKEFDRVKIKFFSKFSFET